MIGVTGATGQLGQLVIESLLKIVPASRVVAIVHKAGITARAVLAVGAHQSRNYGLAGWQSHFVLKRRPD